MKKRFAIAGVLALISAFVCACAKPNSYVLTEKTFFLVMTNIQYYPEQYVGKSVEYDCFTYDLTDINGETYRCGVRKCSSGYGCKCGKDTIIGFILSYDGEIPAPLNQSEDTAEKTWVKLKGTIPSAKKTEIKIYAAGENGEIDTNVVETVVFLHFDVAELSLIEDWSGLRYYVSK